MMLSRFAKMQLRFFAAVSVIGTLVLGLVFLRVPEALGIGRYNVTASFERGAGLYDGAQVNFRGSPVGKVSDLRLSDEGIDVDLSLRDDVEIPTNVHAEIHSMSAVGEQYVDLVPDASAPTAGRLADGSRIPQERTSIPMEIGPVLDNVSNLVESLPQQELSNLLDETSSALTGRTGDLQSILDGTSAFVATANDHLEPTKQLINQSGPLIRTATSSSSNIIALTNNLAHVADALRDGDSDLRTLIDAGQPFAADTSSFLRELQPELMRLLEPTLVIAQLLERYNGNLASILSFYPKLVSVLQSITLPFAGTDQVQVALSNINNPPSCTKGVPPALGVERHQGRERRGHAAGLLPEPVDERECRQGCPEPSVRGLPGTAGGDAGRVSSGVLSSAGQSVRYIRIEH